MTCVRCGKETVDLACESHVKQLETRLAEALDGKRNAEAEAALRVAVEHERDQLKKKATLARESLERLQRLAEGKQGRIPGVALNWIREVTKDALAALADK